MVQSKIRQNLHQEIDQLPADVLMLVAEFLEFVRFKQAKETTSAQRHDMQGLWADFEFEVSDADIATAHDQMWRDFPRDIV